MKHNMYDPDIDEKYLTKKNLPLCTISMACVLPHYSARCEPGLAEQDGSLLRFFTKNQTSSEIISLAFWPKGAYDDVWPSPRDTLHVSTSAKKSEFLSVAQREPG